MGKQTPDWLARIRQRLASARRRATGSSTPRARLDSCWLLTDGSLCVDGWFVEGDASAGAVRARLVQGQVVGPWSPLMRKDRPDVAAHVLGAQSTRHDLGVVGRVAGPVDREAPLVIELEGGGASVCLPVIGPRDDAVPEEVFAGLVVDYGAVTPQSLAPVVGVVRSSPRQPTAGVEVAYRHPTVTGAARVDIVVPVYRDMAFLRNLLRALADRPAGCEVTVVCDDPEISSDLVAWTRTWNDDVYGVPVRLLVHDRNAGFAAACNAGWRSSGGELVLLLNSDVLIDDPVADLDRLAQAVARDDVAAVGPVLLFPDRTVQHAGMEMVDAPDFPGFVLPGHPGKHGSADSLPSDPFDVPMLTGAALLTRRSTLAEVDGVPDVYGRGDFEDVLLSLSLRDRGRLVVDPRVRWTHAEGSSYRRDELGGIAVTLAKSVVVGERTGGRR